ncbi:MAG: hypothetical protein V5A27_13305, partial [Halapricum sp.]
MDSEVAAALADAFPDREVVETRPPAPSWNEQNRTVEVAIPLIVTAGRFSAPRGAEILAKSYSR